MTNTNVQTPAANEATAVNNLKKALFSTPLPQKTVSLVEEALAEAGAVVNTSFYVELANAMKAQGVDTKSHAAATKFIVENGALLAELQEQHGHEIAEPMEEIAGDLHDGMMESFRSLHSHADTFLWVALQVYGSRSPEHVVYAAKVSHLFCEDKKLFGEYIREQLGVYKTMKVASTVYLSTDAIRLTGDAAEKAITATARLINKLAFQMTASGVDKMTKRPELITGVNTIKQGVNHPFKKDGVADTAARLYDENKMAALKKEKAGVRARINAQRKN